MINITNQKPSYMELKVCPGHTVGHTANLTHDCIYRETNPEKIQIVKILSIFTIVVCRTNI